MVVLINIATMDLVYMYVFGQTAFKHVHPITVGTRLLVIAAAAASAAAAAAAAALGGG